MFEGVAIADIINVGVGGAVVFGVMMGWLIPRRWHADRLADMQSDRDAWREIARQVMGNNEATLKVLEDIRAEARRQP